MVRSQTKKKILSILFLIIPSLIFAILLYQNYYCQGHLILSGEGSYYTDFLLLLKNYGFTWYNFAAGSFATTINYLFHLTFLQTIIPNERVINFIMIYLIYFLPFLAVYLLSLVLKLKPYFAFLIALFYLTNPFTATFLKSINHWNMLASYLLPAFFLIILKFYQQNFKLFSFFGLHSLFFAFTNINPPLMAIYQIAIPIFVIITSFYQQKSPPVSSILKKYLLLLTSFFLFNFYWIINWFYVFFDAQAGYTKEFALTWLAGSGKFIPAIWKSFSLTGLLAYPVNPQYDYFAKHFSHFYSPILLSIPILIIIYFLLRKESNKKLYLILSLVLILIGFLSKGVKEPFGSLYQFMVLKFPLFHIFKSAPEKWGILFTFLLTLFLIYIFKELKKNKIFPFVLIPFLIYLIYCSVPFVTGNFLPDYQHNNQLIGSKKFINKPEYQDLKTKLNTDPQLYRILSLPGSSNYQIALRIEGKRFYTGNDPILNNTSKPFIAPYNGTFNQRFPLLFEKISHPDYFKYLPYLNIKKIVINKDMYPWFFFQEKETIPEIEAILDKKLASSKNKIIDLYDTGEYFLPRFYIPQTIHITQNTKNPFAFLSSDDYQVRSVIYSQDSKVTPERQSSIPKITFIRINPTKYKIKVEAAKQPYYLVFSESFHRGWKACLNDQQSISRPEYQEITASYFNGDIKEGQHRNIFLDKNTFETWGQKTIPDNRHLLANNYANSWYIKPEDVNYKESYELIIEYWPQRLFYFGAAITCLTILSCLAHALNNFINSKRKS